MRKILNIGVFLFFSLMGLTACTDQSYTPKPQGFFRIYFPKKAYQSFTQDAHFSFQYPKYALLKQDTGKDAMESWYNIYFPDFKGELHLTYYDMNSKARFDKLVEDARAFAFKHTVKANAIDQTVIHNSKNKVYGLYYNIEGNTASSLQFFLTDSVKHYFRAALYFNERPHYDSIQPVVQFLKQDIDVLVNSFRWKD